MEPHNYPDVVFMVLLQLPDIWNIRCAYSGMQSD